MFPDVLDEFSPSFSKRSCFLVVFFFLTSFGFLARISSDDVDDDDDDDDIESVDTSDDVASEDTYKENLFQHKLLSNLL